MFDLEEGVQKYISCLKNLFDVGLIRLGPLNFHGNLYIVQNVNMAAILNKAAILELKAIIKTIVFKGIFFHLS